MDAKLADGFVVVDTDTGKVWKTHGKYVWAQQGHAKNAWNVQHYGQKFGDQTRYVVRPVRFIDMETGDYLT